MITYTPTDVMNILQRVIEPLDNWKEEWAAIKNSMYDTGPLPGNGRDYNDVEKRVLCEWVLMAMVDYECRFMPYDEYLKTEHWQKIRKEAIVRAGDRCAICNATGLLHGHHRTYKNRGNEKPGDVIALCADCHAKFHDKEVGDGEG